MVMDSKKILRLRFWFVPPQQRRRPQSPLPPNRESFHDLRAEKPESSLLAGKYLSHRNLKQVPKGFLAVYVGPELRRFVIPTSYLSMPDFGHLMERMAEEFGFNQEGGLKIPCEEEDFKEILGKCWVRHQMKAKNKKKHR